MTKFKKLSPFEKAALVSPYHVQASWELSGNALIVEWSVNGPIEKLILPPPSDAPEKKDGLYRHTCFEVFIKGEKESYLEWNFSPSGDWCGFSFESYRNLSTDCEMESTHFETLTSYHKEDSISQSVKIDWAAFKAFLEFPKKLHLGVCTVLEHKNKQLSYWALKHLDQKPNFHLSESFSANLST